VNRPTDPRAGAMCTACNRKRPDDPTHRKKWRHCQSPTCTWWRCDGCKADNDLSGANTRTYRDGTPKSQIR